MAVLVLAGAAAGQGSAATPSPVSVQPGPATDQRARAWREDLAFLVEQLPKKHKNAFFRCPKQEWERAAAALEAEVPSLSDAAVVVRLRQLVALLGDGHTSLWIDENSTVPPFRQYPIAVVWLADGFFVAALPEAHESVIGQRLVRIGATPVADAADRVSTLQAHDNESGRKNQARAELRMVETLEALGIVADAADAEFVVADTEGRETTLKLSPMPAGDPAGEFRFAQKPDPSSLGISRRPGRFPFGHEVLAETRTFYIWYDQCSDHKDKSVSEFAEETLAALDAELAKQPPAIDRAVIDFRRNGGGNSMLFLPLMYGLSQREPLMTRGALFGLIGRGTFSSGMMNAYQLRGATKCLLVGEPTGGTPNGYGEVKQFTLPNSRLIVQYSTKRFRFGKGTEAAIDPDIPAEPDSAAFFSTSDAVLRAAEEYRGD